MSRPTRRGLPRRSTTRRILSAASTATTVAAMLLVAAPATASPQPVPGTTGTQHPAGSAAEALGQARRTGKPVPVPAATTPTDTLVANPNGTLTLTASPVPVRTRQAGEWITLDATLVTNADGTLSPRHSASTLTLSGGGSGPLAIMDTHDSRLSLSVPVSLPHPTLTGATATYANVLPGVDLTLTATTLGGFHQVLIVHNAHAAADPRIRNLVMDTTGSRGLSVTADATGNLRAVDSHGRSVFTAPAPRMWDSTTAALPAGVPAASDPHTGAPINPHNGTPLASSPTGPGHGAHTAAIGVRTGKTAVTLVPDVKLLASATYPVYLDPSWTTSPTSGTRNGYASVAADLGSSNKWNNTADSNSDYMQTGNADGWRARFMVNFGLDLNKLNGATIYSAQLNMTNVYSYSCTARTTYVYAPPTTLNSSNATWNYWFGGSPGVSLGSAITSSSFAWGHSSSCTARGAGFDVITGVRNAVSAKRGTQTFVFTESNDAANTDDYKEFSIKTATLSITYNHTPNVPTGMSTSPKTACSANTPTAVGDGPVTLYAPVSDPDGKTVGVRYNFWKTSTPGTILASSDPNVLTYTSGSTAVLVLSQANLETWAGKSGTNPGAITKFSWHVQTYDGYATSTWSTTCNFTFDPTRPGAPQPVQPTDGAATVGQSINVTVNPPDGGTVPTAYLYQLNAEAPGQVAADSTGHAQIPIVPRRVTNQLSVTSLSSAGNVGDYAAIVFNAKPAAVAPDADMTGDGVADLLNGGGNALPNGLWLNAGAGNGKINPVADNLGTKGDGVTGDYSPDDFAGGQAITGHFANTGIQDVLVYYPNGRPSNPTETAGQAIVLAGNGDGSALPADSGSEWTISAGNLKDGNALNPRQLVNIGDSMDTGVILGDPNWINPDLLATNGDATNGYYLNVYPTAGIANGYSGSYVYHLTNPTPDGDMAWNNWTLATTQVASGVALFLWNKTTGELDLWQNVKLTDNGNITSNGDYSGTLTYTPYILADGTTKWNQAAALTLHAGNINGDSTPDIWTVDTTGKITANLVTNLSAGKGTVTPQAAQSMITANHAWMLNDLPNDTNGNPVPDGTRITSTADSVGTDNLIGSGNVAWNTGDLYSPDAQINTASTGGPDASGTGNLTTSSTATAPIDTTKSFTVSLWAKPIASGGVILSEDGAHSSRFIIWKEATDNSWRFAMATGDTTAWSYNQAAGPPGSAKLGVWTHLVAVYHADTYAMSLYVDDSLAATGTHTAAVTWPSTGGLVVGRCKYADNPSSYYSGQVSNLQVWNSALVIPNDPKLVGAWDLDGNGADASGNSHGLTTTSVASWPTGYRGSAARFNGTTSQAPADGPVLHTDKSFTFTAWAKLTDSTRFNTVVSQDGVHSSAFYLQYRPDIGEWSFTMRTVDSDTSASTIIGAHEPATLNVWTHVAATFNVNNKLMSLYINGVLKATVTFAGTPWYADGPLVVGRGKYQSNLVDWFTGDIDMVRAYSGALTADQVYQVYDHDSPVPTLEGGWNLNQNGTDTSANGYGLDTTTVGSWVTGHESYAAHFDGTASHAATAPRPVLRTDQSFTVAGWVRMTANDTFKTAVSIDGLHTSAFYLQYRPDAKKWCITLAPQDTDARATTILCSPTTVSLNTWTHLAATYNTSNHVVSLYVNGALTATVSYTYNWTPTGSLILGRGWTNSAPADWFSGDIDQVRVYQGALTDSQVSKLYSKDNPFAA